MNLHQLNKTFNKVGGVKLLLEWLKSGVLFFSFLSVILLGFSKKALELTRLSVQLKIQRRLSKRYLKLLNENIQATRLSPSCDKTYKTVWICWFQGIEDAPYIVKKCIESIKHNLSSWQINIITFENLEEYISLPKHIEKKWKERKISNTHLSDIIRIEVLVKYGGLWLDATVLSTSSEIPEYITTSDLFLFQVLKPGLNGHCIKTSSWLIYAKKDNIVLKQVQFLLNEYWKSHNRLIDYFLLHHFISITLETLPEEWSKIPKVPNSIPHILLLQIFEEYNDKVYNHITSLSCFHKLSYKRRREEFQKKNTYYDVIINQGKWQITN